MTATTIKTPTGKQAKTYYNSGTRATPVWVAITGLSEEKFNYGNAKLAQYEDREMARKIQQVVGAENAVVTAKYRRLAGKADAVWDVLIAHSEFDDVPIEFAIANDDIAYTGGIKYHRFFGIFTPISENRDVGQFVDCDILITEVEHWEGTPAALCPLLKDQTI